MPADQVSNFLGPLPIILIIFIWYFLVIKPHRDKQKQHKETLKNLQKNDRVITIGGIHGTVVLVKENTVILRVDENVRIEFDKESITTVIKEGT